MIASPTAAELDCLRLMARGLTVREVADERGCAVQTVKNLLGLAYTQLGARNARHAIAILDATRPGWRLPVT